MPFLPSPKTIINLILSFILLITFYQVAHLRAESLSVSLSVGLTYFSVNGQTSPGAVITIMENLAVLATTTADASGNFTLNVLDDDGLHTYGIYATLPNGDHTITVNQSVSLTPGSTTTLNNLILPPTLISSHNSLPKNTDLQLSGYGIPNSQIQIFLANSLTTTVGTNTEGSWSATIGTTERSEGIYQVVARNLVTSGATSLSSTPITFTITAPITSSSSSTTGNTPTTSPSPNPLVSPVPKPSSLPSWLLPFDIDGDGKLSFSEYRDSLILWAQTFKTKNSETCDIDQDGDCDLHDFSILLYYIGR